MHQSGSRFNHTLLHNSQRLLMYYGPPRGQARRGGEADADSQMFLRDRVPQLGLRLANHPSTTSSPVALGRPLLASLVTTCALCFAMLLYRSGL